MQRSKITVVAVGFKLNRDLDRLKENLGRDLFDLIGKTITQKRCPNSMIKNIDHQCTIKKSASRKYQLESASGNIIE